MPGALYTLIRETLDDLDETTIHCHTEHDFRNPNRWLVGLGNAEGSMMIEVIFENGGIVACVLNNEGFDSARTGRLMNAIVNRLDFHGEY